MDWTYVSYPKYSDQLGNLRNLLSNWHRGAFTVGKSVRAWI